MGRGLRIAIQQKVSARRCFAWALSLACCLAAQSGLAQINEALVLSESRKWQGTTSFGLLRSTMHPREAEHVTQALFSAGLSAKLTDRFNLAAQLLGHKDLNRERYNRLNTATVRLAMSLFEAEDFGSELSAAYQMPVEKDDVRYDRFRGAFVVSPAVSYVLQDGPLLGLALRGSFAVSRRFYEYDSNEGGFPLVRNTFTSALGLSYPFLRSFSLSLQVSGTQAWDFDGDRFRDSYSSTQTISYRLNPNLSFSIGHTTGGYTFDYSGVRYDVRLYDRYASRVFGSVAYNI